MATILRSYSFGDDSELLVNLFEYLVAKARDDKFELNSFGLRLYKSDRLGQQEYGYSHSLGVRRDEVRRQQGRLAIDHDFTTHPEGFLLFWRVDKLDIIFDQELPVPDDERYRQRTRVGLVILRLRHWVSPSQPAVRRFKVVLKETIAPNGNVFATDSEVEELGEYSDAERATMATLATAD